MGVSPASAVSTAMNLFSILTLPMGPKELDQDMAKINSQMHDLLPKLFVGYDRTVPPSTKNGGPVEIQSLLVVDHIEELNEFEQTLNFHGTLMMMWRDERLIWEAEDFGQLGSLAFTGFDLTRFWWPDIVIKGITMPTRQILMFHNGIYTLKSSGLIIAELTVSIKAACRIDLKNYPYDNQTCFVFLFTPAYPSARVTFSTSSAMFSKESLQGSIGFSEQSADEDRSNILNTTMADLFEIFGGFNLIGMNVQRFFAYGQFFTVNESVAAIFSNIANTVLRYEIRLQRHIGGVYTATVSIPIFCITVMAFVAMTESNARRSLLWLIVCLILMLLQNDRMMQALPADFDSEPFCVNLSRFLLLQLVFMLIFRVWYAVESDRMEQQKFCDGNPSGESNGILPQFVKRIRPSSVSGLCQLQFVVRCILAIETVLIFWRLFC